MKQVSGDLITLVLEQHFDVIIHGCNCFCTMGRGIANTIKQAFPEVYQTDLQTKRGDHDKLGTITTTNITLDTHQFTVVNAYTQFDWRGDGVNADYDAIASCFKHIKQQFSGKRIGYPLIGAGLAGGDWDVISQIIQAQLVDEDHTLVIYQPQ